MEFAEHFTRGGIGDSQPSDGACFFSWHVELGILAPQMHEQRRVA